MYTLMFIGYVVLSLFIAWNETLDKYGLYGVVIEKGKEKKEALAVGFSVVPFVAVILTIVYWGMKLAVMLLIFLFDASEWIYHNMP